jgi:hypothetical protein
MMWKRVLLSAVFAAVAVLTAFFLSKALLTRWHSLTEPHGDGQVGLSILFGSAIICYSVASWRSGASCLQTVDLDSGESANHQFRTFVFGGNAVRTPQAS